MNRFFKKTRLILPTFNLLRPKFLNSEEEYRLPSTRNNNNNNNNNRTQSQDCGASLSWQLFEKPILPNGSSLGKGQAPLKGCLGDLLGMKITTQLCDFSCTMK